MANDHQPLAITEWEELSQFLFDLAVAIPDHMEMLFRLSDKAKAEAERLRRQCVSGKIA